jgi:hypothetical protein
MTKNILKLAAALAVTVITLPAQVGGVTGSQYQQAGQMGATEPQMPRFTTPVLRGGGRGPAPVVAGKPLSATEERKTVQTLGDGTQLENSDSNLFYRDGQGRTRMEQTVQGRTRIVISDPVAHTTVVLDPVTKTARKNTTAFVSAVTLPFGPPQAQGAQQAAGGVQGAGAQQPAQGTRGGPMPQAVMRGGRGGTMTQAQAEAADSEAFAAGLAAGRSAGGRAAASQNPAPTSEELGVETVNGVAAQGTRNTQIIPAGRIGNNRDLHVVNERWYSNDLQMLVKTVNSDPRFGVTTYQLANIVQGTQDPSLFQIPADYAVAEPGQ